MRPLSSKRAMVLIALLFTIAFAVVAWAYYSGEKRPPVPKGGDSPQVGYSPSPLASTGSPNSTAPKFSCNEPCHSKNQAIVRMHDATRRKGCMNCHRPGENLIGGGAAKSSAEELAGRKASDPNCIDCHKTGGLASQSASVKGRIVPAKRVGGLFCPKCAVSINPAENAACGKCGGRITRLNGGWRCSICGPLVDVDEIVKLSREKPSNEVCALCHRKDDELKVEHIKVASGENWADQITNCLGCHKSHDKCSGCHFGPNKQ
ncbi:MAG: hypothetical protein M1548_05380 [Actinobacteria bacterium]|nr:hypothetical protein [Actinomycetota bacterium]